MKIGIISDIHSNFEALKTVLRVLKRENVGKILCAGDLVGYGADPKGCINLIKEKTISIIGNHDAAVLGKMDLNWFNAVSREAILFTARVLSKKELKFLSNLPIDVKKEYNDIDIYMIHGSPSHRNYKEYVFYPHVEDFKSKITILGHTHIQRAFILRNNNIFEAGKEIKIKENEKYLINPGSVGQPRDYNPDAGFCIIDLNEKIISLKREKYDIEMTANKIIKAGLPKTLAKRLFEGV